MEPEIRPLEYNTTMAVCDSTVGLVITKLLSDYPSLKEYETCSSKICQQSSERKFIYLTYQIDFENNISNLQQFINDRTARIHDRNCFPPCSGNKNVILDFSHMHLIIDVLIWEGNQLYTNINDFHVMILTNILNIIFRRKYYIYSKEQ